MILNQYEGDEGQALSEKIFCDMFGCPAEWQDENKRTHSSWYKKNPQFEGDSGERQGSLIFFDGFPTEPPRIEEDIMNVHYPDYYREEKPPTDSQSPNPINFLTVAKDIPFQFILGVKENRNTPDHNYSFSLDQATEILIEALTHHGIGAKTAVGYGRFKSA
jgi:CRISPR-associated protein Cmr6